MSSGVAFLHRAGRHSVPGSRQVIERDAGRDVPHDSPFAFDTPKAPLLDWLEGDRAVRRPRAAVPKLLTYQA